MNSDTDSIRPGIIDAFKKLNLETKEDRQKYSFGASVVDGNTNDALKTVYITKTKKGNVQREMP